MLAKNYLNQFSVVYLTDIEKMQLLEIIDNYVVNNELTDVAEYNIETLKKKITTAVKLENEKEI